VAVAKYAAMSNSGQSMLATTREPLEFLVARDGVGPRSLTAQDIVDAVAQGRVREEPDLKARLREWGRAGARNQPLEAKRLGARNQPLEAKWLGGINGARNQPLEAKRLGGINGARNQPLEAKGLGGINGALQPATGGEVKGRLQPAMGCEAAWQLQPVTGSEVKGRPQKTRQSFLRRNGYFGEDAIKICQDAHRGMLDKIHFNKHMTECFAAGCAFESKSKKPKDLVRHNKQVLAMEDVV
jgi:hypothetical protein